LEWLEPPPEPAVQAAEDLLRRLGAVDVLGALTEIGRRMARFPLHPRLARVVVEAEQRGSGHDGCAVAALLSAGDRLPPECKSHRGPSDLLALLDSQWSPRARLVFEQIRRVARPRRQTEHDEQALLISVLTAFPDRVARRRQKNELLLASGGSALLATASVVRDSDLLVAVDIEERRERGLPLVRLASAVEAEWLLDLFPERVTERNGVKWNRAAERAEGISGLLFENIVLEETRSENPDPVQAARLLAEKALEAGISRFADAEEVERFLARVAFASKHSAVPCLGEGDVRAASEELCQGLRSFSELRSAAGSGGLLRTLRRRLTSHQDRLLDETAPARIRLPGGRSAKVNYSAGKPPWMASRLQDFFGMRETPTVAGGKVPVVLHLLAPNQRPVQTTTDLAGFWERLYPQVRRELSRRYPKHAWPEDPLSRS
jgi:ATP-dependent helicase HrpB